jgi:hypothetical protein
MRDSNKLSRNEIFDLIFSKLKNELSQKSVTELIDNYKSADYEIVIEDIIEEIKDRGWGVPSEVPLCIRLNYKGKQIIEKYKTYSEFIKLENEKLRRDKDIEDTILLSKYWKAKYFWLYTFVIALMSSILTLIGNILIQTW